MYEQATFVSLLPNINTFTYFLNYRRMKNLFLLFTLSLVVILPSCTKEKIVEQSEPSNIHFVYDWATGQHIATLTPISNAELESRSPETYAHGMSDATTKFGFQVNIFQGGTQIFTGPWTWIIIPPDTTYVVQFNGDNANEYTWVVNYKRKLPGVPCSLTINWSNFCSGASPTETFVIGVNGSQRSHTFLACE
jgi:hypothetical protein